MSKIYKAEEIFHDIPGDPDNVMMTIPEDVRNELGWKEGDTIKIELKEGALHLSKKDE